MPFADPKIDNTRLKRGETRVRHRRRDLTGTYVEADDSRGEVSVVEFDNGETLRVTTSLLTVIDR